MYWKKRHVLIRARIFHSFNKDISTRLHIEDNGSNDHTYIRKELNAAWGELKEVQTHANQLRTGHRIELA